MEDKGKGKGKQRAEAPAPIDHASIPRNVKRFRVEEEDVDEVLEPASRPSRRRLSTELMPPPPPPRLRTRPFPSTDEHEATSTFSVAGSSTLASEEPSLDPLAGMFAHTHASVYDVSSHTIL